MRKTLAVAHKELRQIGRDRRTLLTLLFMPALFLLLYGYALNFDIRNVTLAIEDRDRSTQSRALVSAFVNSGYFEQVAELTDPIRAPSTVQPQRGPCGAGNSGQLRPRRAQPASGPGAGCGRR